ncbi:fimbrial protein, partial [Enterobacter hormaechei]
NVNAGHERTSKARIIHQIQLIRGITSDGNTATGVAVKLYESDRNTQIKIGDISQSIDLAEGEDSKTLNFYANYNATTDVVSTGEADADANFLMVYN